MRVIPAIDLRDGKCVRLAQGQRSQLTVYSENPVEVAGQFLTAGVDFIHLVDLDGAFGKEQSPYDLDTIADLQNIPSMLLKRGYSTSDVENVMHGNWLRFITKAWS